MKLVGTTELVVVAVLVGLIAFMPGVRGSLVSSPVGKAVGFGAVVWLWKQHNELVALLLAVALLRACPAFEHAKDMTPEEKKKIEEAAKASSAAKPAGV